MNASLLSPQRPTTASLPAYMAIRLSGECDPASFSAFTPKFMQVTERLWLLDMSLCMKYWEAYAERSGRDVVEMMRDMIVQVFRTVEVAVGIAAHPWHALLLASYLEERRLPGLVTMESPIGRSLYQQISWTVWFQVADVLGEHFAVVWTARFNGPIFKRQCKLMRAAVTRLKLKHPYQLNEARSFAVQRRFGTTLAMFWSWTQEVKPEPRQIRLFDSRADFPWVSFVLPERPSVSRILDFPLWQWDSAEPLVREDLDRLCQLPSWGSHERVTRLRWRLTFEDMRITEVEICYRHPHALHRELGNHKTTLLQVNYAFVETLRNIVEPLDFDFPEPVVGWELTIDERLILPSAVVDLFGDCHDSESGRFMELENQLPVPMRQFDGRSDWLPENSFQVSRLHESPWLGESGAEPWRMLAGKRPMFLYEDIRPWQSKDGVLARQFLERTSAKWWAQGGKSRDYYCLVDAKKIAQWVFQDSSGQWFIHGVFA